jgi:hypothetical protein
VNLRPGARQGVRQLRTGDSRVGQEWPSGDLQARRAQERGAPISILSPEMNPQILRGSLIIR